MSYQIPTSVLGLRREAEADLVRECVVEEMADRHKNDPVEESWTDKGAAPPEAVEFLPIRRGMILAGRYAIEQIIGRGGSGVVVRAHDRDLRAEVAIKIVRAELAGQRVWTERLAREVRLARQINHPNVCRVFDFE